MQIHSTISVFNPSTESFPKVPMNGTNVGDLLNKNNVTWGWFQGGFKPTNMTNEREPVCGSAHVDVQGQSLVDYLPHHEPFQYYSTTANPNHLAPTSVEMIGRTDRVRSSIRHFRLLGCS